MGLFDLLTRQQPMTPPIAAMPSNDPIAAILAQQAQPAQPSLTDALRLAGARIEDAGELDGANRAAQVEATIPSLAQTGARTKGGNATSAMLQQQLYKMGQASGLKGQELLSFIQAPDEWAKNYSTRVGYHDAGPGSNSYYGDPTSGGTTLHNDMTGMSGDTPYAIGADGQATYGTPRAPTYAEQTSRATQEEVARENATKDRFLGVRTVGPESSVVDLGGGAGGPVPAASSAPNPGAGASLGDRNNNPGNIRPSPTGKWQGQTGVDPQTGYAVFDTPQNGARAADRNLAAYATHGITTPEALVARWASTSPPNEQAAYAARIRAAAGNNFDLSDPRTRQAILPAIAVSEGTHLPAVASAASPAPTISSGARVLYTAPGKPTEDAPTLTDDAVQQLAEGVVGGGPLPTLGVGKNAAAAKTAILNRVGEIQKAGGIDGYNALTNRGNQKANAASLVKLTQLQGVMNPAEQAALGTLDKAIAYAKANSTAAPNIPFLGGAIQSARINGAHDPKVTAFKNLLEDAGNEYAKVISGSTGSQGVTDSARKEASGRINEGMTLPQLMEARGAIAAAMHQKTSTLQGQIDAVRGRMGANPAAAQRQAANQQLIQRSAQAKAPPKRIVVDIHGMPVQ